MMWLHRLNIYLPCLPALSYLCNVMLDRPDELVGTVSLHIFYTLPGHNAAGSLSETAISEFVLTQMKT